MLDVNMCTGMAWEGATPFHEKVLHLCETDEGLTEPHDFAERAWDAYVDCLQKSNYYFSVDELLLICALAKVDVAVFKQNGTDLELAGGVFTNGGPLVCTKLCMCPTLGVFARILSGYYQRHKFKSCQKLQKRKEMRHHLRVE